MVKKILIVIGSLIILLLAAAVILPIVYKDKIAQLVKDEANKNLKATLTFGEFDLSLFRSFPDFSLKLDNLSITGKEPFEGDTLIASSSISLTLDLMSIIRGKTIEVKSVRLEQPRINLLVDKDGHANWDITLPDTAATTSIEQPSAFKAGLKSFSLDKARILYDDQSLGFKTLLDDMNTVGKGDFTQDNFVLSTNSEIARTSVWYGGIRYIGHAHTNLKMDMDMDMKNMRFTFKENELKLNELALGLDGWLAMPGEDIDMDLKFQVKQNDFRTFISMIPAIYTDEFKDLKSSGSLALEGRINGKYNDKSMPGFALKLNIANGMFKYPSLPVGVNNVQVDLNIQNPDGIPDHTLIDLKRFHVELGQEPFDARLIVKTPVSDADINGFLRGKINLGNVSQLVPLEKGTRLSGEASANVEFAGRMSAIEQKNYEAFKAAGTIAMKNIFYAEATDPAGTRINECLLEFKPEFVALRSFSMNKGKSDLAADGRLDNLLAYYLKDQALSGILNLKSGLLDLNELMTTDSASKAETATDTSALTLIEVPGNIDLKLQVLIGRLILDNIPIEAMNGRLNVRNKTITLEKLNFRLLDGEMDLNGQYATPTSKSAEFVFGMDIRSFDIRKTVTAFPVTGKIASIAKQAEGEFSTELNLSAILDQKMQPDLNSLSGSGKLNTKGVIVRNFTPLVKVAETLKMDQFKALPVSDVNISFLFENGKVTVEPFDVNLGGISTTVSGTSFFDERIDYLFAMNIPTSKIPGATTQVISGLIAQANARGASLSMGETVRLNLKMTGTVSKPVISTDMKESVGNAKKALEDQLKQEFEKQKKELEEKAKAEADRLKKEAEEKGKAELDKAKKAAEEKAKAEQDRLKKEAEKKAKDALKNVFK